jgi:hypothetical protein
MTLALPLLCFSSHKEKCYQKFFAQKIKGITEVLMPDNTRCDILTEEYAIEVDFAHKWAEAIGQSLHYAKMMNRQAAIVIVLRKKNDHLHMKKLMRVISSYKLPIKVFPFQLEDLGGHTRCCF